MHKPEYNKTAYDMFINELRECITKSMQDPDFMREYELWLEKEENKDHE